MSNIANSRLKSGVKEKFSVGRAAPLQCGRFALLPIIELKPDPCNARKHGRAQIRAIARSIEAFGFNAPILIDGNKKIVAGHGRYEAAKLLGRSSGRLARASDGDAGQGLHAGRQQAYGQISWDDGALAVHLKELSELALDFDIEDIGFELPEIDFRIQSLDITEDADHADEFKAAVGPAVSRIGDLWLMGDHRLYCGSALAPTAYEASLGPRRRRRRSPILPTTSKLTVTSAAVVRSGIASSPWPRAR